MSGFIELLKRTRKTGSALGFGASAAAKPSPIVLTVELPRNDPELAQAAIERGADALLAGIELREAGQDWSVALESEGYALEKVLQLGNQKPCGITVAGIGNWEIGSLDALDKLGFDFLIIPASEAPIVLLQPHKIGKVLAVDHTCTEGMLRSTVDLAFDAILLAAVKPEARGKPMTIQDAIRLRSLARSTTKPVILPSQLSFAPLDLPILLELGIEGLLLTPSVLGETMESLSQVVSSFREAIDKLPSPRSVGRQDMETIVRLPATPHTDESIPEENGEDGEN